MRGPLLTVLSILFWGVQPLAISIVANNIPGPAIAFYKVMTAGFLLMAYLLLKGDFPQIFSQRKLNLVLWALAAVALTASSVLFNSAFRFASPADAQVYFQFSHISLVFIGIYFFRERFDHFQWLGFAAIIIGLALFFNDQLAQAKNSNEYLLGVGLFISSAVCWTLYASFQKPLLSHVSSTQVLAVIYIISTLMLWRYADFSVLANLSFKQWCALTLVCVTNVAAFVSFTEAMKHWEASKIGAISCLTPIVTIGLMGGLAGAFPDFIPVNTLNVAALMGSAMVVAGSFVIAYRRI